MSRSSHFGCAARRRDLEIHFSPLLIGCRREIRTVIVVSGVARPSLTARRAEHLALIPARAARSLRDRAVTWRRRCRLAERWRPRRCRRVDADHAAVRHTPKAPRSEHCMLDPYCATFQGQHDSEPASAPCGSPGDRAELAVVLTGLPPSPPRRSRRTPFETCVPLPRSVRLLRFVDLPAGGRDLADRRDPPDATHVVVASVSTCWATTNRVCLA